MSTSNNSINNQIGTASNNTLLSHIRSAAGQWVNYDDQTDSFGLYNNAGSPEGVIAADIGSRCLDTTNGTMYIKQTDTVNTGWIDVLASNTGFTAINVQRVTATGAFTYTPTAGMKYVIVEMVGGGGGAGGSQTTGAGQVSGGGGGGAGAYAKFLLTAAQVGVSLAGSVGAGGAGGAAGANNGSAGGDTTLATAAPWTCAGGGLGVAVATSTAVVLTQGAGGAVTTGTGTVIQTLDGGGSGLSLGLGAVNQFYACGSCASALSIPAPGSNTSAGSILSGTGVGNGGGATPGGLTNSQAQQAGAAGQDGIAIFTEFV